MGNLPESFLENIGSLNIPEWMWGQIFDSRFKKVGGISSLTNQIYLGSHSTVIGPIWTCFWNYQLWAGKQGDITMWQFLSTLHR